MEKTCLTCQSKLTGRSDKKFCNDACRNEYHNNFCGKKNNLPQRQVAVAMKQNRKILNGLYANGIRKIAKTDLECFGFNFKGVTGLELTGKDTLKLFCFEFNLEKEGNRFFIKKQISKN